MRLATWNVNSLKQRLPRVEDWLLECDIDVLCLQETKVADTTFPSMALSALGYDAVHLGEGRWNGVAIVSRVGLGDPVYGFADGGPPDSESRLLTARCAGALVVTIYVPNGRALHEEHYQYKLAWLDRLHAHVAALATPDDDVIVCGDFNIAPSDLDVYNPRAFEGSTHVSPPERERFEALLEWGFVDVVRARFPDTERIYSWWDYRAGNFHKGLGMRIDHVLATRSLAERVSWALIDRNARKGSQPSDHAPVVVEFEETAA